MTRMKMLELIEELLTRDPARMGQETADNYAEQRAAGKWMSPAPCGGFVGAMYSYACEISNAS